MLAIEKVDGRREVLEGRDSSFRFLGLSGRSVLVELGGFPSVSRKTSDIVEKTSDISGKISHVFPKISDVFVRISDVFVRISDVFVRISDVFVRISHVFVEVQDVFCAVFVFSFRVENGPDFSLFCEGCESKKCKSPEMRARVTRA